MLHNKRVFQVALIFLPLFLLIVPAAFCYDDGFGSAQRMESEHFVVYYSPQEDISGLTRQLNIGPSDEFLAGKSMNTGSPGLAGMLDTLFGRIGDILDMHLYSLKINLKICQDESHLSGIYANLFNKVLSSPSRSFYVYDLNTIYISADGFKAGILGHEIGHAMICHYFAVPPPVKIQEVLAGYVEYQLRKAAP